MTAPSSEKQVADIQKELRGPLLVLLLVVPLLIVAAWSVHDSVASNQARQRELRLAQVDRARVLRFQLDEETGVRGYTENRDVLYLDPYKKAIGLMGSSMTSLGEALNELHFGTSYVEEQSRRNGVWIATVARPLIAHHSRDATTRELHRRGKQLIDDFRNTDQSLARKLDEAADAADIASQHALDNTLAYLITSIALIALGSALFGYLQARSTRAAMQNLVLLQRQKQIADALQEAFLNRNLPVSPAIGLHASYVPALSDMQVGGDWYDAFELPNGRILFSIGDVAGHGLEAAVVMSRARQAIIAASLGNKDPAAVLQRANESIMLQDSRMVTAICGYIDPATLEITYATAGHPAPILARRGEPAYFLPQGGIALGIVPNATFQTYMAHAFDGALIVLYTDGVVEHKRDIFDGERDLLAAATKAATEDNPALAIQRMIFKDSVAADDVAILTMSFRQGVSQVTAATSIAGVQVNRFDISTIAPVDDTVAAIRNDEVEADGDLSRLRLILRS